VVPEDSKPFGGLPARAPPCPAKPTKTEPALPDGGAAGNGPTPLAAMGGGVNGPATLARIALERPAVCGVGRRLGWIGSGMERE
jgi:hypothetical protein